MMGMSECKVTLNDKSMVSPRDMYMRLCACRDFEIKLQWERAVFLTAFLIACYAGYGSFLLSVHQHGVGQLSSFLVKCIPVGIAFVGIVLSLLWILMSKGSKAWYEHYEQAIAAFAREYSGGMDSGEGKVPEYMMAHRWYDMPGIERNAISNGILNFRGGAYSVSKIVIAMGLCSLAIWSLVFIFHCCVTILGPISKWWFNGLDYWIKVLAFLMLVVVAFIFIHFCLTKRMGSGYLSLVKSALPESKRFKMEKTTWTFADGSVCDWIKKQKKKETRRYVLIGKDTITIYESTESDVSEKTVDLIADCIPETKRESRLFICK